MHPTVDIHSCKTNSVDETGLLLLFENCKGTFFFHLIYTCFQSNSSGIFWCFSIHSNHNPNRITIRGNVSTQIKWKIMKSHIIVNKLLVIKKNHQDSRGLKLKSKTIHTHQGPIPLWQFWLRNWDHRKEQYH